MTSLSLRGAFVLKITLATTMIAATVSGWATTDTGSMVIWWAGGMFVGLVLAELVDVLR